MRINSIESADTQTDVDPIAKSVTTGQNGSEAGKQLREVPKTMKPYYEEAGITIYNADCREVLPDLRADSLVTDPVWPNCEHLFPGINAHELLSEALALASVDRIAIQMGCFSDVRILSAVPSRFPFLRVCWLEYACPSYRGRILNTGDVAYVFGEAPPAAPGRHILPGKCVAAQLCSRQRRPEYMP